MDSWPVVPALSGLTRLDLLHVPPTDGKSKEMVDIIQRLPNIKTLSIVFGCVDALPAPPPATSVFSAVVLSKCQTSACC